MDIYIHMPEAAPILFIASTLYCILIVYWVLRGSVLPKARLTAFLTVIILAVWIVFQLILSEKLVYIRGIDTIPPKIAVYGVFPFIVSILFIFNSRSGKLFIDSLPLRRVTTVHIVRVFVEIGLYYVFIGKRIPEAMTFSGQNFDILAGLTAPFIIYFGFIKNRLSRKFLLGWNFVSLSLLTYIISLAFLSASENWEKLGFEQPNTAVFEAPYSLLPTFIVPTVIFMHLVAIRQLIIKKND